MKKIRLFKALSDETRYKIIELLLDGEKCVCEILPYLNRTQSTVSLQLGKLEDWGVLQSRREGKKIFYKIKNKKVCDLLKVANGKS